VTREASSPASDISRYFWTTRSKSAWNGRGRAMDNIFTERLWRTVKYQEVYINDYVSPREARLGLTRFFEKYNKYRLQQSLNYLTPAEVYYGNYTLRDFE